MATRTTTRRRRARRRALIVLNLCYMALVLVSIALVALWVAGGIESLKAGA